MISELELPRVSIGTKSRMNFVKSSKKIKIRIYKRNIH